MGATPIILAFLGFIFLWVIVNYSTFQRIKKRMEACYEALIALYPQKLEKAATLMQQLQNEQICSEKVTLTYQELVQKPTSENILEADKKINEWLQDCLQRAYANDALVKSDAFHALKSHLATTQAEVMQAKRQLKAAINDHNALSEHMPSQIIAWVFGFKPIQLGL